MTEEKDARQWEMEGDHYRPVGKIFSKVKAGIYEFEYDMGLLLQPVNVVTDDLIDLPDSTSAEVLVGIKKFWTMENRYREHGLLYKRSVGLYGPPGAGKTITLVNIGRSLIQQDGLVINFNEYAPRGLAMLRQIEPKRRIVCLIEDLDAVIDGGDESEVLSLLDGETQIDGIVYVATTNYFEKLPSTLVNRPSRFDEWRYVGMPSNQSRAAYLSKVAPTLTGMEIDQWVRDTDGFSIAHLKELVAAVLCLEYPYAEVLERLRKMLKAEAEKE